MLIDRIFEEVVNISKDELSKTLYMDINDIGYLHKKGHTIGSHSYSHPWLNSLERSEQENEIDLSLNMLGDFLDRQSGWIMCYPFGGYDKETIKLLKKKLFHGFDNKGWCCGPSNLSASGFAPTKYK